MAQYGGVSLRRMQLYVKYGFYIKIASFIIGGTTHTVRYPPPVLSATTDSGFRHLRCTRGNAGV